MDKDILFNLLIKMTGDNKVIASINQMNAGMLKVDSATVTTGNAFNKMVNNINNNIRTIKLSSVIDQIDRVATGLNSLNGPGMALSTSMYDLQAMTGVAGDKLKEIEGYARASAKTFGGSAADGVESYKLILGQLSPEIAKVPQALKSMGESVSTTSKLMGGDTTAAAEVLNTAMNQYNVSLQDPIEASRVMAQMMNVMAAAAGEGSAELPQIKQALEQSGMAAKAANVAFEETNSAIQVLDKAGKKGSEGGVALRNVLSSLGQGRFLPKRVQEEFEKLGINVNKLNDPSLTLSQRLNMLKPLLKDSALMSAMFGKENANAAMALISQTGEMDRLTEAVKGTSEAYDQAAIVMESPAEKNARLKAQVDDLKISLFNATNGWLGYTAVIGDVGRDIGNLLPLYELMKGGITRLVGAQKLQTIWTAITTKASALLAATMWGIPIVWIVAGIAALIAIVVVCWNKFEGFRKVIFQGWEAMKLFGTVIKDYVINRFKELLSGITGIGKALMHFFKGEWSDAWETGKKAAFDITGIGSGAKAFNQFSAGYNPAMKAGELASKLYTNKKNAGVASGIASPGGIPGADPTAGGVGGGGSSNADEAKKTNESIATGGTKHNYITLNFKDLIGIQNYSGSKDSASQKAGEEVIDQLLRYTASAITAGS